MFKWLIKRKGYLQDVDETFCYNASRLKILWKIKWSKTSIESENELGLISADKSSEL